MISWVSFKAYDDETDWIARESVFQAERLFEAVDRTHVVELPSDFYERVFVLSESMAVQRAGPDPRTGFTRHDLLIAGSEDRCLGNIVKAGIVGYRSDWQHMQSGYHTLPLDLDSRIGYLRAILDRDIPFWRE